MIDFIRSLAERLLIKILLPKEKEMIAILFTVRIINDNNTFDDVPPKLKEQVAENLIDGGLPELVPVEYGGTMQTE